MMAVGEKTGAGEPQIAVILAVDLENFTDFSSSLSSYELSLFIDEFKNLVRTSVISKRGKVIKFLGDGAISIFRTVEEAVESAREMVSYYQSTKTKAKVSVIIGEVFLEDQDVFGHDVNFAFRILDALRGGTIALSESAFHVMKDKRGFVPSAPLSVKGIGENIRIFVSEDPAKCIRETDDVKFFVKEASLMDRFMSFYLDVLIFVSSLGLASALSLKQFIGVAKVEDRTTTQSTVERGHKEQEELKVFELETPLGRVKAGRGKIDIETQRGEIHTEPGKVEVKLGERKKFSISYLHLSGIEVVLFSIYLASCWYIFRGRTIGEWIMKIRVEKVDRSPPDLRTSILRAILLIFMVLPAGLGIIIPLLVTRERSFVHDILTKTRVVRD